MNAEYPRAFGKYHLLSPLAHGGMGVLYLAAAGDRDMQKLCVIKTILPHLADSEYVARFRDEAKVVVRLTHGNLVPVFDAGQVGGEMFLAMEFVEGKDLRAVWNRCAKKAIAFPVDVAVYLAKELARGLHYAHTFGDLRLVHRDVSPPNVLVAYSGEVKLTDFGLATSTLKLEKTAPGVVYGKVSYMSPEQARGEPLDGRTDVYAAGIILWELLTGRQLFPAGDAQPQDLIARCRDPKVDPPSSRAPRVPKSLDPTVLRALAARREERYQSGEEFRVDLAGYLAREAPATDSARVSTFLHELFGEDIDAERKQREDLLKEVAARLHDREMQASKPAPPAARSSVPTSPPLSAAAQAGAPRTAPMTSTAPAPWGAPRPLTSSPRVPSPRADGSTVLEATGSRQTSPALALSDADPILGCVVADRYKVLSLIGEGGMGRVYAAEHIEIGKRVALKILHPVYGRMPEVVERFRREARAASKIGHPNIVDVTDSGTTTDGSVFFVMEYLEGVELAEVIDREGALPIARAVGITSQICRALAAAHTAGIIHRDLKPENVFLVARDGSGDFVKVLDFGIAKSAELEEKRAERLTSPGMAMGTPEYMAPEQAAGKQADARADVYAAGAIFYEMITGVTPFDGENFMEILTKKATQLPPPPRQLRPDVPEEVDALVMRTLARDPAERPQSMEAFEYELNKCLVGRGAAVAKVLGMLGDPSAIGLDLPDAHTSGVRRAPPSDPGSGGRALEEELRAGRRRRPLVIAGAAIAFLAGATAVAVAALHGPKNGASVAAALAIDAQPSSPQVPGPVALGSPSPASAMLVAARPGVSPVIDSQATAPAHLAPAGHSGPTREETRSRLADCNRDIAQLRFSAADGCFKGVLASSPYDHATAYYGLAEAAFNDGRMGDAVRYSKSSIDGGGGDEARVLLGDAYLRQGNTAAAVRMYQKALAHNPGNQRARAGLDAAQGGGR